MLTFGYLGSIQNFQGFHTIFHKHQTGTEHVLKARYSETAQVKSLETFKGQLILKCPFGVFKSPKKPTNFFPGFLP